MCLKSSAKMSGDKLYYFHVRGRAEICRLSFSAAEVDFEDIRLNGEEWAKEKACEYFGKYMDRNWRCSLSFSLISSLH